MVNVDDLWVGDLLKLSKSGRIGKYLGVAADGRFRVQVGDKIILVKNHQVSVVPDQKVNQKLIDLKEEKLKEKLGFKRVEAKIDLHIEVLKPSLINAVPDRIVDVQLKAFEEYMELVTSQHLRFVTIIHGKGTGLLREAINTYLNAMDEVNYVILVNNGGATDVYLK